MSAMPGLADKPVEVVYDLYVLLPQPSKGVLPTSESLPNHYLRLTTSLYTWLVAGWITVLAIKAVSVEEEEL